MNVGILSLRGNTKTLAYNMYVAAISDILDKGEMFGIQSFSIESGVCWVETDEPALLAEHMAYKTLNNIVYITKEAVATWGVYTFSLEIESESKVGLLNLVGINPFTGEKINIEPPTAVVVEALRHILNELGIIE